MIRVAHIMGKWLGGGVENVVLNYYKNIDRTKIQFDFIIDEDSKNIPFEELEKLGAKIILVPPYQKIFKYQKKMKEVLKNYKIVHSHINTLSVFSLRAGKRAKVKIRIAHSHSTSNKREWKKNILKNILRPFSNIYSTNCIACSDHAGKYLFRNRKFKILNNAIELEKFKYNKEIREKLRKELNIEDKLVFGHIGRFVKQKNHDFLIDIFYEIQKRKEAVLILIGEGALKVKIKEKVKKLNIEDKVIFLGQVNNVNDFYQVFDVFLFPSIYEGLGIAAIEAQVSGLKVLVSDLVPKVAKINDNIEFLSLNDLDKWVIKSNKLKNRKSYLKEAEQSGFNIKKEVKKLEKYYFDLLGEN